MIRFICLLILLSYPVMAGPAYDRLEKTNTIRCGYQYWDGGVIRDETTGELNGLIVDLTNELAKNGGFDVEWVGPLDWGQVKAELASGKIDMMCAGMWQAGQKARYMIFSKPFTYQGVQAFIREDEARFQNYNDVDNDQTTLITVDADNSYFIAESLFPNAKKFSMPLGAADSDMLQALINNKGDIAFTAPGLAYQFEQANPETIKPISNDFLRVFGNTYVVNSNEFQLMHYIETLLAELENAGYVEQLIDRYNKQYPHMFIKKSKPYNTK